MRKKCLLLYKWPSYYTQFLVSKFSKFYDTEYLYISNFKNKNFSGIIKEINDFIKSKNIEIVFFDVDFIKLINFFFIKKIENVKKILVSGDDYGLHEMNAITASACDLVLSHCPLSVLKYKEKGYEAFCMPIEGDGNLFRNYNLEKEIDVLFFGRATQDRKEFLDFVLSKGISVKMIGEDTDFVSIEELSKHISKSKIVLNLSKSWSRSGTVSNYASEDIYKFYYMLKGRVAVSGLCGTLCISEYTPALEIIFREDEIPTFYTKEECVKILKRFLEDKELLSKTTAKFCTTISHLYEDKKNFEPIYHAIEKKNHRRVKLSKIPYWYLRIAAKQVIVRNIKLSNFLKTISQFRIIFEIVKNSNFQTKLLVIFESITNVFGIHLLQFSKVRINLD